MKNLFNAVFAALLVWSGSASAQTLIHIDPAKKTPKHLKHTGFTPHGLRGTISCGVDTVYYTTAKTTSTEIKILFSNGTYSSAASQYFPAASSFPITVDGFKWYGYSVDQTGSSNPSINVECEIYAAGTDSLPTGSALASTTITVDTVTANAERDAVFSSPVTVSGGYCIVIRNSSSNHLYILSNDEDGNDGGGERLSGTFYEPANDWRKNEDLWAFGDFDYLFSPFITKDLTADFDLPATGCVGTPAVFDNTSTGYWNNRFYNTDAYAGNPIDFDWSYGDANTDNNLVDGSNSYASSGNYNVSLDATYNGWTVQCTEVVVQSFDVFDPPPAPSATSPAPVCEYTPLADLTASGTGGDFTWYGDSISGQLGTGSPWTSGIETVDTVWVTETLNGCEGPATEVPLDFFPNPIPTWTSTATGNFIVDFTGAPASAVSYAWDFDDGSTATQQEPTHSFATAGPYNVCLEVTYSNGCVNDYCEVVSFLSVDDVDPFNASIYPNPAENILNVSVDMEAQLRLLDATGRVVWRGNIDRKETKAIDISGLPSGSYFLEIFTENRHNAYLCTKL